MSNEVSALVLIKKLIRNNNPVKACIKNRVIPSQTKSQHGVGVGHAILPLAEELLAIMSC